MILVDITVPSVDTTYDFKLDANTPIGIIVEEITQMICQKEKTTFYGEKERLLLASYRNKIILERDKTLKECGITSGDRLLLV